MSPEERALATLAKRGEDMGAYLRDQARGLSTPCPANVATYMADAIRAAEDEALELAALALDGLGETDRNLTRKEVMYRAASVVRSLKSGSVKGDRDGR